MNLKIMMLSGQIVLFLFFKWMLMHTDYKFDKESMDVDELYHCLFSFLLLCIYDLIMFIGAYVILFIIMVVKG